MDSKRKTLTAAVAGALAALGAGQAFALPPSSWVNGTQQVYISGSSALNPTIAIVMAKNVCTSGSLDQYVFGANDVAYFCTRADGGGNVVVYKSSVNGSGNGVVPFVVSPTSSVTFLSMASIAATPSFCPSTSTVASVSVIGETVGVPSYVVDTCDATQSSLRSNPAKPDAGLSDIEPSFFTTTSVG